MITAPAWITWIAVVADFLVKAVALGLVPERRKPSSATGWLVLIFLVPGFGILAFLLIGSPFVNRRRRKAQERAGEVIREHPAELAVVRQPDWPAWLVSATRLNRQLGWLEPVGSNSVTFLPDYDQSIQAMAAQVESAQEYVHVEFYIANWDTTTTVFFEAMAAAAERGVRVRFLFDHLGSFRVPGYKDMLRKLEQTKIEWHPSLPLQPLKGRWRRPDLRNHRKIVVVDGRTAFTGSQNMIHPSYHNKKHERLGRRWKELMTQTTGPVAHALNLVFATDWYLETGEVLRAEAEAPAQRGDGDVVCQVVPSGPGFPNENNLRLFNTLIYAAEERLSITSPYFVPDESLLYAITTAAQRGVSVELFVSEIADQFMVDHAQKSYYTALLEAGVRIMMYGAPAILHAKHFSVDDQVAVIGSSNMDIRSFALDFEVSVLYVGEDVVRRVREVEDDYRLRSRELTLAEWRRRPIPKRYVDNVMRLTSALQ